MLVQLIAQFFRQRPLPCYGGIERVSSRRGHIFRVYIFCAPPFGWGIIKLTIIGGNRKVCTIVETICRNIKLKPLDCFVG